MRLRFMFIVLILLSIQLVPVNAVDVYYGPNDNPTLLATDGVVRKWGVSIYNDTGLQMYLPMEAIVGAKVLDSTLNHNDAIVISSPTVTVGAIGNGLTLDGSDDAVRITENTSLMPSAFTMAFWFKPHVTWTSDKKIVGDWNGAVGYNFWASPVSIYGGTIVFGVMGHEAKYNVALTLNTWYHVTGTFDGGNVTRLYVNGKYISTAAIPHTLVYYNSYLYVPEVFHGEIDEVRFYNRVLGEIEVNNLYHNTYYEIWDGATLVYAGYAEPDMDDFVEVPAVVVDYTIYFIEAVIICLAFLSWKIPIVGTINILLALGVLMMAVINGSYSSVDQLFAVGITLLAVSLPLVGMRRR